MVLKPSSVEPVKQWPRGSSPWWWSPAEQGLHPSLGGGTGTSAGGRGRRQSGGGGRLTCRGSPCASQGQRTDPGEDISHIVKPEVTSGAVQAQVVLLAGNKVAGSESQKIEVIK